MLQQLSEREINKSIAFIITIKDMSQKIQATKQKIDK
jgi:hypothetical protein